MKKTGCSRAIGIPTAPDALAIALTANHQTLESRIIEVETSPSAQRFDGFHEYKIGGTRAVARRRGIRQDKEFAGCEVRGRLQSNSCDARSRIAAADRHLADLFEDEVVKLARCNLGAAEPESARRKDQSEDNFRQVNLQDEG